MKTLVSTMTNDYKTFIADFFKENYKEILSICKKSVDNTQFHWEDLYGELYIYVIENQEKIQNLVEIEGKDRGLMRFIATWCYNNVRLYSANAGFSNFQSKFKTTEIIDFDSYTKIYPKSELTPIEDIDLNFNIASDVIQNLNEIEKKIFDLYINQGLSYRKIAERINISQYTTKNIVNEFKNKMKAELSKKGYKHPK